ncbi:hypothetical protein Fmac_026994 [Flemingia macrophylla]|uniref:Uncharacterized protein n=1 Tax=Flemingia macrophylla TaxID=520843 RepID=A0ABD1LGE5_9FABA
MVSPTSVIAFEHRTSQNNVGELSGELSIYGTFEFSTMNDRSSKLSNLVGSLRALEKSCSRDRSSNTVESWDKSGISYGVFRVLDDRKESVDFNELNQH